MINCNLCKYYKRNLINTRYSTCKKFFKKNEFKTNENEINEQISICRTSPLLCGLDGRYFEKKNNLPLEIINEDYYNEKLYNENYIKLWIKSINFY